MYINTFVHLWMFWSNISYDIDRQRTLGKTKDHESIINIFFSETWWPGWRNTEPGVIFFSLFFAYSDVASVDQTSIILNQRSLFQRYFKHFQEKLSEHFSLSWNFPTNVSSRWLRKYNIKAKRLCIATEIWQCFTKIFAGPPLFSCGTRFKRCMEVWDPYEHLSIS